MAKSSANLKELQQAHEAVSAAILTAAIGSGLDWFKDLGTLPHWFPYAHQHISKAIFESSRGATLATLPPDIAIEVINISQGTEQIPGITPDMLQSAWYSYERAKAASENDPERLEAIKAQFEKERPGNGQGSGLFGSLNLGDTLSGRFLYSPPPDLDYIFDRTFLNGTVGAVAGPGGVGKSTFLNQLLMSVASGETLIPSFVPTRSGKVLGIFCEEDEAILHDRTSRIANNYFPPESESFYDFNLNSHIHKIASNYHIVSGRAKDLRLMQLDRSGNYSPSAEFYNLLRFATKIKDLRLIVLDPLSRLYVGNENDNSLATFFISLVERLSDETGAGILMNHHTNKGSATEQNGKFSMSKALHQDALRGASGITNGIRWQCNLQPLPGDVSKQLFKLDKRPFDGVYIAGKICKQNYGPPKAPFYLEQKGGFLVNADADRTLISPELKDQIIKTIKSNEEYMTIREFLDVYQPLWKDQYKVTRPRLTDVINAMISSSEIFLVTMKNSINRDTEYLTLFSA